METSKVGYVRLDGMLLRKVQLLELAMNVGSYAQAEHYLFALVVYGLQNDLPEVLDLVNDVRRLYGVQMIPFGDSVDDRYKYVKPIDVKVKDAFLEMPETEQHDILRYTLKVLESKDHAFQNAASWLSVLLVLKARIYGRDFKAKDLMALSEQITPVGWPQELQLSDNAYKNLSRRVKKCDKDLPYYEMTDNPQPLLCEKLWNLIKEQVLDTI